MKVKDAINEAGMMIPDHNAPQELMYLWLTRVEGLVYMQIMSEKAQAVFTPDEGEAVLSVPDPYSAIYPLYLQTMIYLYLGEYDRYNYLNSCFEKAWSDYAKHYVRTKG